MVIATELLLSCGWGCLVSDAWLSFVFFVVTSAWEGIAPVWRSLSGQWWVLVIVSSDIYIFLGPGRVQQATWERHGCNWKGLLFRSPVLSGVTEDAWRADHAVVVAPVAFVAVNGASGALHHKISVPNVHPWHVTGQQTTDLKLSLCFAGVVQRIAASHRLFLGARAHCCGWLPDWDRCVISVFCAPMLSSRMMENVMCQLLWEWNQHQQAVCWGGLGVTGSLLRWNVTLCVHNEQ